MSILGLQPASNTSEERVQRMEQLKPTYTTRRAQKAQQLQDLKISDRWKLLVCLVVTAAARNPLPLQLALRSVYRGSSHCPGDRKNRALKGGRLEAMNKSSGSQLSHKENSGSLAVTKQTVPPTRSGHKGARETTEFSIFLHNTCTDKDERVS